MVGKSDQNVFLIQIDAWSFAEFEISEFEISRVDCICLSNSMDLRSGPMYVGFELYVGPACMILQRSFKIDNF